jgi:hypothetical protein
MRDDDVEETKKSLRARVVVLLELGRGSLDLERIG